MTEEQEAIRRFLRREEVIRRFLQREEELKEIRRFLQREEAKLLDKLDFIKNNVSLSIVDEKEAKEDMEACNRFNMNKLKEYEECAKIIQNIIKIQEDIIREENYIWDSAK